MIEYKGYVVEGDGAFGLKKIRSKGSGALPKQLHGSFTRAEFAFKQIDQYLIGKETTNGEKASTSRG